MGVVGWCSKRKQNNNSITNKLCLVWLIQASLHKEIQFGNYLYCQDAFWHPVFLFVQYWVYQFILQNAFSHIITWSLCTADIETISQTLTTACPMSPHPWLRHSVNAAAEENMRAANHKYIHAVYRDPQPPALIHKASLVAPIRGKRTPCLGHHGVGGLSCLRLSRVGNSKSSNLASQAAITLVATQIRPEKKNPSRLGVCLSMWNQWGMVMQRVQ